MLELCYQIGARNGLYTQLYPVAPNLALTGRGKFINRPTVTGGKKYDKYFVYIPTDIANDSQ